MLNFFKKSKMSTKKMQSSRIIITYLILWEKLALNGARMVKIALGGENFVFGEVGEMRELCLCFAVK
jgi:hypothetical protein